MYNKWEKHHEYDSKNPTFSSTLLDKINKSLKTNPQNDFKDDLTFFRQSKGAKKTEESKMSTLRRANLVEKFVDKKVSEKVTKKSKVINKSLVEEFDVQDTLFFSTTSTTSSSSSEAEYFENTYPKQTQHQPKQPRVTCFPPPQMPKQIRTRPKPIQAESNFIQKDEELLKSRSRAVKIYSNLKHNLNKQPISPGVRLSSFINSLFNKDNNKSTKKNINVAKPEKIKASYSTCTTPTTSYSKSWFTNKEKKVFQDDKNVIKRTVKFCPVSVIVDENARPCGHKSLLEEGYDRNLTSKFARSLSKRYEELRVLNGLERKNEEVALDLLSGYCWDSRLSRVNGNIVSKDKVNECDYGDEEEDEDEDEDEDDDGLSCSSSDLFELDHLSLVGDELPVYETTRFDSRLN